MTNRLPTIGDKVRNKITGFTGIIISHARHLTGCDRMWVEPHVNAENKPGDGQWADIDILEIVEPMVIEPVVYTRAAPGGVNLPKSQ